MRANILFVDDEPNVLKSLGWLFADTHLAFHGVRSPLAALDLLAALDFAVAVADQRMPEMSGVAFLEKARRCRPDTVRVLVTACADVHVAVDAINRCRVYGFLFKPWDDRLLRQTVERAVARYRRRQVERSRLRRLTVRNRALKAANRGLKAALGRR